MLPVQKRLMENYWQRVVPYHPSLALLTVAESFSCPCVMITNTFPVRRDFYRVHTVGLPSVLRQLVKYKNQNVAVGPPRCSLPSSHSPCWVSPTLQLMPTKFPLAGKDCGSSEMLIRRSGKDFWICWFIGMGSTILVHQLLRPWSHVLSVTLKLPGHKGAPCPSRQQRCVGSDQGCRA